MIRNLVFDFGNVLVRHDLQPIVNDLFNNNQQERGKFLDILSDREFVDTCDRGIIPFDEMLERAIKRYPKYENAIRYFNNHYLDEITGEVAGMKELLKKLKKLGYRLYGLTNWSNTIYRVMDKFDIFNLLDGWVISCEEHTIKPEKEIYIRLCDKYNLSPEECLFTDDRETNVSGAIAAGMKAVLFTDVIKYRNDLLLHDVMTM